MKAKGRTSAVAYLRVSGKGQVDGDGFPRQREAIRQYAESHGLELVAEYRDEGVSGTKDLEHREGLAALIDRIESNGVRVVLVERADRLARDLMVGEIILGQLRDLGVKVIEAKSGTDLTAGSEEDDPTRTLIRQVLGAVAQFEKSVIVLKLRAARDRIRRRDGRCEGRKPYGHTAGERAAIDRIWQIRRTRPNGKAPSFQAIADQLNAEHVPTRYGKPWQASAVRNILGRGIPQS